MVTLNCVGSSVSTEPFWGTDETSQSCACAGAASPSTDAAAIKAPVATAASHPRANRALRVAMHAPNPGTFLEKSRLRAGGTPGCISTRCIAVSPRRVRLGNTTM